jgi:hypothetical protein
VNREKRTGPTTTRGRPTIKTIATVNGSLPRPGDIARHRRHVKALDLFLELAQDRHPVPYADGGMTLGWREREWAAGVAA